MARYRARLAAVALTALVTLTGCSDDDIPSDAVSRAASEARSVGAEATAAFASATAAGRKFDEVKGVVDAKDDVKLGAPGTDGDGRTTVEVTVDNTAGSTRSFLVQVDFTDQGPVHRRAPAPSPVQ